MAFFRISSELNFHENDMSIETCGNSGDGGFICHNKFIE